MKKATKIFIYLLLVILLTFFITKSFVSGTLTSEILYESFLAESNGILCKLKGGKVFVDSNTAKTKTCIIKYEDAGKNCDDNIDCEGFCFIENDKVLKEKLLEICEEKNIKCDGYIISADELAEKTRVKIQGYCSGMRCVAESEIIIRNGKARIGQIWKCPGYFE